MKKKSLLIFSASLLFLTAQANAQVGVGTNDPKAALDVTSTDDGLLIPRVALTATNAATPLTTPTTSEMVYNTATVSDVTPGYYYWEGAKWVKLATGKNWSTTGNSGTTAGTDFIGTTDDKNLVVKTNNAERMNVSGAGIAIGAGAAEAKLHVKGAGNTVRIENLNSTNNATYNNGSDIEPVYVNASGDLVLGGTSSKLIATGSGAGIIPGQNITSNSGGFTQAVLTTKSITLSKKALVSISYQTSVTINLANGNNITDGAPRLYGGFIRVNGEGLYGYSAGSYTNSNSTAGSTVFSGLFSVNGTAYVELPAGTHTITVNGFVAGGSFSTRGTFGGNNFESVQIMASY